MCDKPPETRPEVRLSKQRRARMAIDWREIAIKVDGFEPDGRERIVGTDGGRRALDSYLFIRKQEYFNNFKQLGAVG